MTDQTTEKVTVENVILGFTAEGEMCVLETADPTDLIRDRLRFWLRPGSAEPFHHDVHAAVRRTSVQYLRDGNR